MNLRNEYKLGTWRITWYLERYHGINVSESSIYRTQKRNGINPLKRNVTRKGMGPKRDAKETPGHHVQVDVKFLVFQTDLGERIKRHQCTAIDDCTRIRAMKVYKEHNYSSSNDFMDYVIDNFPFRIHTVLIDNGHQFQSNFNWHVKDLGMEHRYIKPIKLPHKGKVESLHLTDKREFYQLLSYSDDVYLNTKIRQWESYYNFERAHCAFKGKTPYEILCITLKNADLVPF